MEVLNKVVDIEDDIAHGKQNQKLAEFKTEWEVDAENVEPAYFAGEN